MYKLIKSAIYHSRVVVFALAATFLISGTIASPPPKVETASFKIECRSPEGVILGVASGVVIAPGIALTALHVPDMCEERDGRLFWHHSPMMLSVTKRGSGVDLALLSFPIGNPIIMGVDMAERNPEVGSDLYVIAYPGFSEQLIHAKGIISGYYTEEGRFDILTDANITFGDSGGGVFNNKKELIGIVSGIIRDMNAPHYTLGVIVPISVIQDFIKQ